MSRTVEVDLFDPIQVKDWYLLLLEKIREENPLLMVLSEINAQVGQRQCVARILVEE